MTNTTARIKPIIMDKSPAAGGLRMSNDFGYDTAAYQELADAVNLEFGINVTAAELSGLITVNDVCTYIENLIPGAS